EISPEVGQEVSISRKHGLVTAVSAGRVRVDFNNPLAGKTLKYVVKATRKAKTAEERVRAIIDMDYGLADQFKLDLKGGSAEIHLPDVCKTDEQWFVPNLARDPRFGTRGRRINGGSGPRRIARVA